ncbi:WD40 repeat protein [Rutstroemia sp. NJR-2017a WRK4]|nr:WD40 repeat protein [Rutstroemia sp. NJR-2017a WRK4]
MPTPAPALSPQFTRLANVWKLLALRSDVDNIILELIGQFSLEKVYSDGDKETYQHLVITLLAQLNAVFYVQRLSLPSETLQNEGYYLGFLVSWEVTLRSIEFVLQIVIEGRESLWETRPLRDKYLAEFLLSALRVLQLLPRSEADAKIRTPAEVEKRCKARRDRFARIHRSLERMYDSYPGPKSFLLLVCKEVTESLRGPEPNALALPLKLREELPNLAAELYPLNDCFTPKYISTLIPQDGSGDWLGQFLTLRDITQFAVAASIQYAINGETRDAYLLAATERNRDAVLRAIRSMRIPPRLSRDDLIGTFTDHYRIVLLDTPDLRRQSMQVQIDDRELGALDALCLRLSDRQIVHRVSDREMMHTISEITKKISTLDDPSRNAKATRPRIYTLNCSKCHIAGASQMRYLENLKFPLDSPENCEIKLPAKTKCIQCGEPVTLMREMTLASQVWDLLEPYESHLDAINLERHAPTYFQLPPPRTEGGASYNSSYTTSITSKSKLSFDTEPPSPFHGRTTFASAAAQDRSRSLPYNIIPSQISPSVGSFSQRLDTPSTQYSSTEIMPVESSRQNESQKLAELRKVSTSNTDEITFAPDHAYPPTSSPQEQPGGNDPGTYFVSRSATLSNHHERKKAKGGSKWMSAFTTSRKESMTGQSLDTSSLSSSTIESQRLNEISLDNLVRMPKKSSSSKSKAAKAINVFLSQNSTNALFWTQSLIQIWDVGASPPAMTRVFPTESSCYKAAVTKTYLAYIIGTRDPRLTLRIVNLQTSSVVEYPLPTALWASSIAISPNETTVAVGFNNATVYFYKTTGSAEPREDRLHSRVHQECDDCPDVETLSYSDDGMHLLASTRSAKTGLVQIYFWMTPNQASQELPSCRYLVPLHESEDRGISSAIFRSKTGIEEVLICISTWTQSGVPVLVHPKTGQKTDIRTESSRHGKLGSRIQCASFSPSGKELAMVNEKGHLYLIAALNSTPLDIRKVAVSRELTIKSDSFAMAFMSLPDEESAIVMAWIDPSKTSTGMIRKIPLTSADASLTTTPVLHKSEPSSSQLPPELPGDVRPIEMIADEEPVTKYRMMGFVKHKK